MCVVYVKLASFVTCTVCCTSDCITCGLVSLEAFQNVVKSTFAKCKDFPTVQTIRIV